MNATPARVPGHPPAAGASEGTMAGAEGKRRRFPARVVAVAAIAMLAGVALVDSWSAQERQRRDTLTQHAESAAAVLGVWASEWTRDTLVMRQGGWFNEHMQRWQLDGSAPHGERLTARLGKWVNVYGWSAAVLLAGDGRVLWSSRPESAQLLAPFRQAVAHAQASRAASFSAPVSVDGRVEIGVAAPMETLPDGQTPMLLVIANATVELLPRIEANRSRSPGADLLVLVPTGSGWSAYGAAEGGQAPGMALRPGFEAPVLSFPRSTLEMVAGKDDGTRAYLGAARPVPGTNWWVLASSDEGAALRDHLRQSVWVAVAALLAMMLAGGMVTLWRRDEALAVAQTERAHQAKQLHTLRLLEAVVDGAGSAVFAVDNEGHCLLCNAETSRLFGLGNPPGPGEPLAERLPAHALDGSRATPATATRAADETWQTQQGSRIYRVTRGALQEPGGTVFGRYAIARDVTEQREASAALQRSEERLLLALQGAHIGLWDWHIPSGQVSFNAHWADMLGYQLDELRPQVETWRALVHPEDWPAILDALEPHLAGHSEGYRCEHRLRHRDGHWVWVLDAGRVVERDAQGQAVRAVGIHLDVTDRKLAQEAMEQARQELEARVAERTAQLSEATRRAESANVAKSAFLANMSHEIRTPMNAIIGLTGLVASSINDPAQLVRLEKVGRAASHLMAIINDILDLSKIEAGRLTLEQLPVALPEIVEQVRSLLADTAQAREVHIEVDLGQTSPRFIGDPTRLRQALLNLVSNAVKFTQGGQVRVRVSEAAEPQGTSLLRFEVEDTGIGLTDEQLSRLFKPFEQADTSTTRHFGGTGLGLAITERLVHLMGGEVGACSRLGAGSTFWFTARLSRDDSARPHAPHPAPSAGGSALEQLRRHGQGRRVLLVEDDPVNQEVARVLLARAGVEVALASDGAAALAALERAPFDAVLMDLHMPGMDGLEATREWRRRHPGSRVPVIALTASVYDDDRRRCLEAGMQGFVVKPVEAHALYGALAALWAAEA